MRRRPKTGTLFLAIAGEAEACLKDTAWEDRLNNILNLVAVIRWRILRHWEKTHQASLDALVAKAKGGEKGCGTG